MKVAIVGAGFCGLATAWNFFNRFSIFPDLDVTVFDSKGIGGGASGIAAGLLHSYAGAHAKLNWRGLDGFEATKQLLSVAAQTLDSPVTAADCGILRLAGTPKQQVDFLKSPALLDPYVAWLNENECQQMIKGCISSPALWIKNGLTVYCSKYLEGLWLACKQKGAQFEQRHISSLLELKDFLIIIITAGALSTSFEETSQIPLKIVKGQVLELSWPHSLPPLTCAINSHAYIVMKPSSHTCIVGASYEKKFDNDAVDLRSASQEILPKAVHLLPALAESQIIQGYSGLRAVSPTHLPFFKQINSNSWLLTGMGSKGLLYHALMAKELVETIYMATCK